MNKQELRTNYRELERNRPQDETKFFSKTICERLVALDDFKNAKRIGVFLPLPTEVQIDQVIEGAWKDGKTVCVPYFHPEKHYYGMSLLNPGSALKTERWNVREPADPQPVDPASLDLILVPAMAFDRSGNRLGHGGGHYDRLLEHFTGIRIGLAFHDQIAEALPIQPHDQPVQRIITETGIIEAAPPDGSPT